METTKHVIHVTGSIKEREKDVEIKGVMHYHLLINNISVIHAIGVDASTIPDELFCAIRYGDNEGLGEPISGLESGNPIELQGVYIDKNHAYPSIGNPGDPVLHYTHHPVGFVVYNGKRYE
ncbi:hypothetical protein [Bacillus thuringiensis]|uniref:hypothetical protein n=1 Tax=Bacillus thuringiensis TaxID=1428 RepID=UPI002175A756|nr:hypothetical protein [Bacillus thuringiensis]